MSCLMGWAGIYLDTASPCIAAIVLSICIDDTIHFIYHYKHLRKQGLTQSEAQYKTMNHIGSSVIALIAALFAELIIFPLVLDTFDHKDNY